MLIPLDDFFKEYGTKQISEAMVSSEQWGTHICVYLKTGRRYLKIDQCKDDDTQINDVEINSIRKPSTWNSYLIKNKIVRDIEDIINNFKGTKYGYQNNCITLVSSIISELGITNLTIKKEMLKVGLVGGINQGLRLIVRELIKIFK
jgi:hypothetical protein